MMLKKLLVFTLVFAMLLSMVACGSDDRKNHNKRDDRNDRDEQTDNNAFDFFDDEDDVASADDEKDDAEPEMNYDDQISLIVANRDQWAVSSDDYYMPYSYAVTDLDQNGRLELIVSVCMGTGFFSYTDVWQVNEALDALELCETEYDEYASQADIIVNQTKAYTDGEIIYYIFADYMRSGWAWNGEYKRAYLLSEGRISEMELAGYEQENFEDGSSVINYHDSEGEEITESEYENYEAVIFDEWQELEVTFLWQMYEEAEFNQMDETALFDAFVESWEGFYVG